jgi:hypothetical protein
VAVRPFPEPFRSVAATTAPGAALELLVLGIARIEDARKRLAMNFILKIIKWDVSREF